MKSLFFIFGILFSQYIMPLMDNIGALILVWIESKKAKHNEIITHSNIRMKKAVEYDDEEGKKEFGFTPPIKKEKTEKDDENED